ncbi:hypothetical protein LTR94_024196, partial [Friedmanniomyces endolithicus]
PRMTRLRRSTRWTSWSAGTAAWVSTSSTSATPLADILQKRSTEMRARSGFCKRCSEGRTTIPAALSVMWLSMLRIQRC